MFLIKIKILMKNIFFDRKSQILKNIFHKVAPPRYLCKVEKKRHPEKKNRKINLTFGVFGVIPSYLVRMGHI